MQIPEDETGFPAARRQPPIQVDGEIPDSRADVQNPGDSASLRSQRASDASGEDSGRPGPSVRPSDDLERLSEGIRVAIGIIHQLGKAAGRDARERREDRLRHGCAKLGVVRDPR